MGQKKFGKEKRQHPRLHSYLLVKYRLLSQPDEQQAIITSLKDISGGGLCLYSKEKLPLGELIKLRINFPPLLEPIPCLAKIVWVKDKSPKLGYEVGLQFVEIADLPREMICKQVESINNYLTEDKTQDKNEEGR